MTPQTREMVIVALRATLDTIRNDLAHNADYYTKGTYHGQHRRSKAASNIVGIRRALREIDPLPFPVWMARPERALDARRMDPR